MRKWSLKIDTYCPLVMQGFCNSLGLFQVIMTNPEGRSGHRRRGWEEEVSSSEISEAKDEVYHRKKVWCVTYKMTNLGILHDISMIPFSRCVLNVSLFFASSNVNDIRDLRIEELKAEFEPLTKLMKEVLGDKVRFWKQKHLLRLKVSRFFANLLTNKSACLVFFSYVRYGSLWLNRSKSPGNEATNTDVHTKCTMVLCTWKNMWPISLSL